MQIAGEAVQLVNGLGALHGQPAFAFADVRGFEVVPGSPEARFAGLERHPRPAGEPFDLSRPAGRLDLVDAAHLALFAGSFRLRFRFSVGGVLVHDMTCAGTER